MMHLPTFLQGPTAAMLIGVSFMGACVSNETCGSQRVNATVSPQDAAHPVPETSFRGVFFNPQVTVPDGQPWLVSYPLCRAQIRTALHELADTAGINLVAIFVCIRDSLKEPSQAPREGQPLAEWANLAYLNNVAAFVGDCHEAGVAAEIDLATNMWVPCSVEPTHQIANQGTWPMPSEAPWNESAMWYREAINYIEQQAEHPESIAMWCMMGNYALGPAEPFLWEIAGKPAVLPNIEEFVKRVWPVFRIAGKRPKAAPILLPIFATDAYWGAHQMYLPKIDHSPEVRLSAFSNLKRWLVDDMGLPPDYWVMTTYPFCDPAPDGVHYLREIVRILGPENASRIVSTDLKGPGHDNERADSVIPAEGRSGPEMLEWHFEKCAEYGFAGWWIWAYQDSSRATSGIRTVTGEWKQDLVEVMKKRTEGR